MKLAYKVIQSDSLEDLSTLVSEAMSDGFMPAGGLTRSRDVYMQAVALQMPPKRSVLSLKKKKS